MIDDIEFLIVLSKTIIQLITLTGGACLCFLVLLLAMKIAAGNNP